MKQLVTLSLAAVIAASLQTQGAQAEGHSWQDRLDQLNRNSREMLEELMEDMRPVLEDQLLPLLMELSELIDDIALYEMPEILPNGDIIIRRRMTDEGDAPTEDPPVDDPIDL